MSPSVWHSAVVTSNSFVRTTGRGSERCHQACRRSLRAAALSPGWQKKVEPFPVTLDRGLRPLPAGYSRGVFDAHAVIYNSTGMIIDAVVLF